MDLNKHIDGFANEIVDVLSLHKLTYGQISQVLEKAQNMIFKQRIAESEQMTFMGRRKDVE